MTGDTFKVVPNSEIATILKILEKNLTHNFLLHQYIFIMAHNLSEKSHITQILLCSGDFENGTYLIETKFKIIKSLSFFFVYTLANDLVPFKRALMETSVIPWQNSERYFFEVTLRRFTQIICQVFIAKKLKYLVQHYILMWLPPDVDVSTKHIPRNLYLSYLNESHVEEIDRQWPSFRNQKEVLKSEISSFFGLGVFEKSSRKMLSYALCFHSGGVFMLYSDIGVRRKGLADIVARNIVHEIRQKGWIPFCTVAPENNPSMNLLTKIGFLEYAEADFIFSFEFLNNIA